MANPILCIHGLTKEGSTTHDRNAHALTLTPALTLTLKRNNVFRTDEMTLFFDQVYRYRERVIVDSMLD